LLSYTRALNPPLLFSVLSKELINEVYLIFFQLHNILQQLLQFKQTKHKHPGIFECFNSKDEFCACVQVYVLLLFVKNVKLKVSTKKKLKKKDVRLP